MADLQSLKNFVVLAKLKSFARAAEQCNVTASGLSRRIQGLENWLGSPVFDRNSPQLELTDAGEQLLETAAEIVPLLEGVRNQVRRQNETEQNHVRMAAPHVMSSIFFPSWLSGMHAWFSEVKLTVTSAVMVECMNALQRNEVDFVVGFVDARRVIDDRVAQEGLFSGVQELLLSQEVLVPVCRPDTLGRPMHSIEHPTQPEVAYLGYTDECSLGWTLERALAGNEDYPPLPVLQCEHRSRLADGLRSMALVGMGVAWLPQTQVLGDLEAGRLMRAGSPAFDVPLGIRLLRTSTRLGRRAEKLWTMLTEKHTPTG